MLVGPMQVGGYKIVFQAEPPDPQKIPLHDLLGVTVRAALPSPGSLLYHDCLPRLLGPHHR